jgi:hypothetical protein
MTVVMVMIMMKITITNARSQGTTPGRSAQQAPVAVELFSRVWLLAAGGLVRLTSALCSVADKRW